MVSLISTRYRKRLETLDLDAVELEESVWFQQDNSTTDKDSKPIDSWRTVFPGRVISRFVTLPGQLGLLTYVRYAAPSGGT
jgi:hypothetical protein